MTTGKPQWHWKAKSTENYLLILNLTFAIAKTATHPVVILRLQDNFQTRSCAGYFFTQFLFAGFFFANYHPPPPPPPPPLRVILMSSPKTSQEHFKSLNLIIANHQKILPRGVSLLGRYSPRNSWILSLFWGYVCLWQNTIVFNSVAEHACYKT